MSVPSIQPTEPPPPKQGLGGCAMVFLVLIGVVLLLPGLCSLAAMGFGAGGGPVVLIYLLTFAIAAGGVMLIRYAVRNR